jgi:glycosyltransferase involved in cell wall biosynthesis
VRLETARIGGKFHPRALWALHRIVRASGAQLLHSHLSTASWWSGWHEKYGIPSIGHVHGFTSARWHRRQSHLIAVSQAVKNDLIEQGMASERITVLPNPVSPDDVQARRSPQDVRRELGAEESTFVMGTFAHLSEKKGWRDLLEAVPLVVNAVPDVQFWWAGAGPLHEELQQQITARKLESHVRLLGFRRDVADVMNAMDVMALPSHREPFGLVYVEAALLGKPSVACAAGGAPEVVAHERSGLLVPPRDTAALAATLIQLAQDRAAARQLGEVAREDALANFGWEKYFAGLEKVYQSARQQ